jgi:hypothetical protein
MASLTTQRWRYLLCHSGKLRTVPCVFDAGSRKVFVRDRKGYREATCITAPMPVVETLNGDWSY